jgi:hypothetical protein
MAASTAQAARARADEDAKGMAIPTSNKAINSI